MLDTRLENELRSILGRYRVQSFGWWLACLWLIAGTLLIFSGPQLASLATPRTWMRWLLAFGMLAIVIAWIGSRSLYRDIRWIAGRVESRFPNLKQRLWTAMGIDTTQPIGFLPRSVLNETLQHAGQHDWRHVLPFGWIILAWVAQSLTFILFVISGAAMLGWVQNSPFLSDGSGWNYLGNAGLVIEPGDAEIERGTNLLITAKYGSRVPPESWLVTTDAKGQTQRLEMQRNLRDPVFAGYLVNVQAPLEYSVQGMQGSQVSERSKSYRLSVFDYPTMLRSDAKIEAPSYQSTETKNSDTKIIEDTRRITVVEGSRVTWICRMNKPLQSASLVDEQGEVTPLTPDQKDPLLYSVSLSLEESQRWKLRLLDLQNRAAKNEEELVAKVLKNQPPTVRVARATDLSVSPLEELQLQGKSSDDFGIIRAGLTYSLGGADPTEVVLLEGDNLGKNLEFSHELSLEQMGAEPDQLLSYFFWVEDRDRNQDVRRVDGEMFFAEVRPFDEIFRQGQAQDQEQQAQQQQQPSGSPAAQQSEALAELQKKILSGTWNVLRRENPKRLSDDFGADVDLLAESQGDAFAKTDELVQSVSTPQSEEILNGIQGSMTIAIDRLQEAIEYRDVTELKGALKAEQAAYEGLLKLRAREHQVARQSQRNQSASSRNGGQQNRQSQLEQLQLEEDPDRFESERQASQEPEAEREMRQVMNRLEELAKRQKDLNQQLKDLETALQAATSPEKKAELEEELKRLRDNQEELLRDSDELLERMNEAQQRTSDQTQQAMEQAQREMEQARENLQQSNESLQKNQTSPALSAGTRAQQQMEQTRENLRQQSANQFEESMRDLVEDVQKLEQRQQELTQLLDPENRKPSSASSQDPDAQGGLRPEGESASTDTLRQAWDKQQKELERLTETMQETVKEAEASEPLLADKLYDAYREARQRGIDKKLQEAPLLAERGLRDPAKRIAEEANAGIKELRQDIEQAAESVLGSEAEGLRRAVKELDRLNEQLAEEIRAQGGIEPQVRPGSDASRTTPAGQNAQAETEPQPNPSDSGQPASDQAAPNQAERNPPESNRGNSDPTQRRSQAAPVEENAPRSLRRGGNSALDRDPTNDQSAAPLTGDDYARWSDALRDVEEMVRDPELRAEATRIREAAREIRRDYKRFSKSPQWPLVQKLIANPLRELQHQVEQEWIRRTADRNAIVPIDRDPVPADFEKQLQIYYENLGSSRP